MFLFLLAVMGFIMATLFFFYPFHIPTVEDIVFQTSKEQIYAYYLQNTKFPNSIEVNFYPFWKYEGNDTEAKLTLFGDDKKEGTGDDKTFIWTWQQIEVWRFKEAEERRRILEQTAYALCQRRLAENQHPIFPPTLDLLLSWGNLPEFYKYSPFGNEYGYDTSTCKDDYCYCEKPIVYGQGW